MFAEDTLTFRQGVLEARKEQAGEVMRRVYGNQDKNEE